MLLFVTMEHLYSIIFLFECFHFSNIFWSLCCLLGVVFGASNKNFCEVVSKNMEGKKANTTNADRCKRYREKNKESYKIKDALRKKRARLLLKTDKVKYEEQKKKDRERKELTKLRKKVGIDNNSDHLTPDTCQPSFSNSAIKSRTIKRVEKVLPRSPRRKSEVIKTFASKFNVKVKLGEKVGRKKNNLSDQEQQWVKEFLNRADISYTTPGRRDNVYSVHLKKLKGMLKNAICCGKLEIFLICLMGRKSWKTIDLHLTHLRVPLAKN